VPANRVSLIPLNHSKPKTGEGIARPITTPQVGALRQKSASAGVDADEVASQAEAARWQGNSRAGVTQIIGLPRLGSALVGAPNCPGRRRQNQPWPQ